MASPTSPACRFRSAAWKTCWWMRPETDVIRNASRPGPILVAAVDGKGVPMVKPDGARPTARLTKGQKVNRKRMATVAAVFTKNP